MRACACGREAVDLVLVASEDGVLLVPVCAECAEDPVGAEQPDLFGTAARRPLTAMPPRDAHLQQQLPLDHPVADEDRGAA